MVKTTKTGRGRANTGTIVKTKLGLWQAVLTLADGSRKRLPAFPPGTSETMAREKAAFFAEKASTMALVASAKPGEAATLPGDTAMARWFKAWIADRVARGQTSTRDNIAHYRLHILPVISSHVKAWTREDFRRLSRELDVKVQSGALSWKTAVNAWGTATKMSDDATESKLDAIRCRTDNPAEGVRGPDRGAHVGKQFLYPSEFLRFVECNDVPLRWRQLMAFSVFTYVRDGEMRALSCSDVDTDHRSLSVTKAWDKRAARIKETKGRRARRVPLEPTLAPLVEAMRAGRSGSELFIPEMPSERDMARGLRRWLKRAGVTRRELHYATPTTRPIRFHDLRATGTTWLAVRGTDPLKIQLWAGHTDFATTQEYIRMAEALVDGFGDVFPALPVTLYQANSITVFDHSLVTSGIETRIQRGGRDSNPRPPA